MVIQMHKIIQTKIKPFADRQSYLRSRIYLSSCNPDFSVFDEIPNIVAMGSSQSYGAINVPKSIEGVSVIFSDKNCMVLNELEKSIVVSSGSTIFSVNNYLQRFGLYLPVVPGAALATVGGCIATDVHGKNTHKFGTFGNQILRIWIWPGFGDVQEVSRERNPQLFADTIGGIGLTGIITKAEIKVEDIPGGCLHTKIQKFETPRGLLAALCDDQSANDYIGAILDLNSETLRSLMITSRWSNNKTKNSITFPKFLGKFFFRLVGMTIFRRSLVKLAVSFQFIKLKFRNKDLFLAPNQVFFAGSNMHGWNYVYGNGFIERQFLIEEKNFVDVLSHIRSEVNRFRVVIGLCGIKKFSGHREGTLSFGQEGISITIQYEAKYGEFNDAISQYIIRDGLREYVAKMQNSSNTFPSGYLIGEEFLAKHRTNKFGNALITP
jgi:decaprenylphospho-beta-D-ribofuranose 2-oxidase